MTNTTEPKPTTKRQRKMARDPKPEVEASEGGSIAVKASPGLSPAAPAKPPSKSSLVLALLQRPEGARLDQLVEATGWLPHTTRAALTGLKKKGHVLSSDKIEGTARVYRVANAAQAGTIA